MRLLAIFTAAAALALSGCTTIEKIDSVIKANAEDICAGAEKLQAVYLAASPAIPASYTARVDKAYAEIAKLCADPSSIDTLRLTAEISKHFTAVNAGRAAAKKET